MAEGFDDLYATHLQLFKLFLNGLSEVSSDFVSISDFYLIWLAYVSSQLRYRRPLSVYGW
jgi:hypothetical protein